MPFLIQLAPAAHAQTVISITTSNGSTVCPAAPLSGTWSGDTCTVTATVTIPSGTTLVIGPGVTVANPLAGITAQYFGLENKGTLDNSGSVSIGGYFGYQAVYNTGTINNIGSIEAVQGFGNSIGFSNSGTINNFGSLTVDGTALGITNNGAINSIGTVYSVATGNGIVNGIGDTINNAGSMTGVSTADEGGISNGGTINDYCGATLSGGSATNTYTCSTVTFAQSGIPTSGVTWGVTVAWGPFPSFDYTGTGANIPLQATGPLTYSYDTPITSTGTTYGCTSGCSGSATISGATTFTAGYVVVVASSTSVACSPSVPVGSPSTCTADVTGNSPTGTVTFSTSVGSDSQFSSTTCTLASGSCQVTYIPSSSTSPVTITASYGGDNGNFPSSGAFSLTVLVTTTTSVSCSPTSGIGSPSTCTAGVTGDNPTGTVTFSTSAGSPSQFSSTACTLSSGSCLVTYTPSALDSPITITASYGGDSNNAPSSGTFSLSLGIVITTSNGATVCPSAPLSGTWDSSTDTCTVTGTLTVSGTNLDVGGGVTVAVTASGFGIGILNVGAINNYGTLTISSAYLGIDNHGPINNYGTLTANGGSAYDAIENFLEGTINNYGSMSGSSGSSTTGNGIDNNRGTINNAGTMTGSGGSGIQNFPGTINNIGTMTGSGDIAILNGGTINNAGTMTGSGTSFGIYNSAGTINDYCGVTLTYNSYHGNAPVTVSCHAVTFDQTGIPTSGVTWGVTASWGPFPSFDYTGTGAHMLVQATGSLTYSYDTPITISGTPYGCISGCTGSATISGPTTFTASYPGTSVSCSPSSVLVGSPSTCTATVAGVSPTGTVTFSSSSATGTFTPSNGQCALLSGSCSVTYSDSAGGSPTITASYGGDPNNAPSSGTFLLTVTSSYSVTFGQTGIPGGVTWGVTVGGTDYTGTGPSITVSGIMGTQSFSYDSPVSTAGAQYTCSTGCSGSVSGAATESATFTVVYKTTLSTSPSSSAITLSSSAVTLTDTATLAGGYNPTGTITFTLYAPGGVLVDTETVTVSGNGAYTTPAGYALPSTGTVVGTYQWDTVYSGDANDNGASDVGAANEQVTVSSASPSISTTPSPSSVTLGTTAPTLGDTATLSGGYSETGTLTFVLTAPGGQTVGTETVVVTGNGAYTTPTALALPSSGTVAGTYTWTVTYSGDGNNEGVGSSAPESVQVSQASPSLTTTPTPASITLGGSTPATLEDAATISGGYFPTGMVTFTLVGPGGAVMDTETVAVTGDGTYSTPAGYALPTTGLVAGTYQWDAAYSGDTNNFAAADIGATDEHVVVAPASPSISTTPSPASVSQAFSPTTLRDTAALSAGYFETGTLTFVLKDPGGHTIDTETVTVSGDGNYVTPVGFTLPATGAVTGTYQWTASYGGDGNNNAATETGENQVVSQASPAVLIQSLEGVVNGMGLPHGTTLTLDARLSAAADSLSKGNDKGTVNHLDAFVDEVSAQAGKTIPTSDAQQLTADAHEIIVALTTPTSTAVSCGSQQNGQSGSSGRPFSMTCTATVTGNGPTGKVSWTASSTTGSFRPSTCRLDGRDACSVQYTDTSAGTVTITASYGGDKLNDPSSGTTSVTISPAATITTVHCGPFASAGRPLTCTVTVFGDDPTGTVSFATSSSTGTFSSASCTLVDARGLGSQCRVTYTDTSTGRVTITSSYSGDPNNQASSGTTTINFR